MSGGGALRVGGRARAAVLVEPRWYEVRECPIPALPRDGAIVAISPRAMRRAIDRASGNVVFAP
jgi:hypothetical protein